MTNAEKYKTAKEREEAFVIFCDAKKWECVTCPLGGGKDCKFAWLDLEAEEEQMTTSEVADILEEYNKWRKDDGEYADAGVKRDITPKELGIAIDRAVEILRNIKE